MHLIYYRIGEDPKVVLPQYVYRMAMNHMMFRFLMRRRLKSSPCQEPSRPDVKNSDHWPPDFSAMVRPSSTRHRFLIDQRMGAGLRGICEILAAT